MRTLSNSFFALLFASLIMVGCGGETAETDATMSDSTAVMTETVEVAPDTTVAPVDSTVAQPE